MFHSNIEKEALEKGGNEIIMTKKSNSFKNIITVLLALLFIGIVTGLASATVFSAKSETISHRVVTQSNSVITAKEAHAVVYSVI